MTSQRSMDDLLSQVSSEEIQEQEEQMSHNATQRSINFLSQLSSEEIQEDDDVTQMSQDTLQSLYEAHKNQVFGVSLCNKRGKSSDHESDLSEGQENESEDDNYRNTVSADELSITLSQESEQNLWTVNRSNKLSIKHRTIVPETQHESDLSEEQEHEGEDDNNRNTVSADELPIILSQDTEPNWRRVKKTKKLSIKHRTVVPESQHESDLSEEQENESEDDNNRNTVSADELPILLSQDSEPNWRRVKKQKNFLLNTEP